MLLSVPMRLEEQTNIGQGTMRHVNSSCQTRYSNARLRYSKQEVDTCEQNELALPATKDRYAIQKAQKIAF